MRRRAGAREQNEFLTGKVFQGLRHLAAVLPAERGAGKAEAKGHAGKPAAKPVAKAAKLAPKRKATGKAAASKKSRRGA